MRQRLPGSLRAATGHSLGARRLGLALAAAGLVACSGGPKVATSSASLPLTGGSQQTVTAITAAPVPTPTPDPTLIVFVTSPAHRGSFVTLAVATLPRATCRATVAYAGTGLAPTTLIRRTAGGTGAITWTWTVSADVPLGDWPISVVCKPGGEATGLLSVR